MKKFLAIASFAALAVTSIGTSAHAMEYQGDRDKTGKVVAKKTSKAKVSTKRKSAISAAAVTIGPIQTPREDVSVTNDGTPLLSRPADMSIDQWGAVDHRYGFSLSTQAHAYTRGLTARTQIEKMRRGMLTATVSGTSYTQDNWTEFRDLVRDSDNFWLYGLPRWYDSNPTNDHYVTYDPERVYLTPAVQVAGISLVLPGKTYATEAGFNPNFFDSVEEQDAWFAAHDVTIVNDPFPTHKVDPEQVTARPNGQAISSRLFVYSDGMSPSGVIDRWITEWKAGAGAEHGSGTSPYKNPTAFQ